MKTEAVDEKPFGKSLKRSKNNINARGRKKLRALYCSALYHSQRFFYQEPTR